MPSATLCKPLGPPARPRGSSPQSGETAVSAVSVLYGYPKLSQTLFLSVDPLELFSFPITSDPFLTSLSLRSTVDNNLLAQAPPTRTGRAASHPLH